MADLRWQVSEVGSAGSQQFAIVEETYLGFAAVRLMGSSARLTNLPIHGTNVSKGETVVVDFSAETPYVRPLMTIPDLASSPAIPLENIVNDDPIELRGITTAKVTTSNELSFVSNAFTGGISRIVPFDKVLWDPEEMLFTSSQGIYKGTDFTHGFLIHDAGTYIINSTFQVISSIAVSERIWIEASFIELNAFPHVLPGGRQSRHRSSNGVFTFSLSFMMRLRAGDVISVSLRAVTQPGMSFMTYTMPLDPNGKYPYLEIWKVSSRSSGVYSEFISGLNLQ